LYFVVVISFPTKIGHIESFNAVLCQLKIGS
jgi:hypothetical protein